jgi:hypothetical protein
MPEQQRPSGIDTTVLSQTLGLAVALFDADDWGTGIRYRVGKERQTELDVYPSSAVITVAQAGVEVIVYNITAIDSASDHLVFTTATDQGRRHLLLAPNGAMLLVSSGEQFQLPALATEHAIGLLRGDTSKGEWQSLLATEPPDDYGFDDAEFERLSAIVYGHERVR